MREINLIVVHCSATPEGKDFTVKDIDRWHRQRGFNGIGYHYVVYRDGSIHEGRKLEVIGAHAQGYNSHSIGVCYIGGTAAPLPSPPLRGEGVYRGQDEDHVKSTTDKAAGSKKYVAKDTRTPEQKVALRGLLTMLKERFPKARIVGHYELGVKKACPCFCASEEYKDI